MVSVVALLVSGHRDSGSLQIWSEIQRFQIDPHQYIALYLHIRSSVAVGISSEESLSRHDPVAHCGRSRLSIVAAEAAHIDMCRFSNVVSGTKSSNTRNPSAETVKCRVALVDVSMTTR